jgi:hypothetical protein
MCYIINIGYPNDYTINIQSWKEKYQLFEVRQGKKIGNMNSVIVSTFDLEEKDVLCFGQSGSIYTEALEKLEAEMAKHSVDPQKAIMIMKEGRLREKKLLYQDAQFWLSMLGDLVSQFKTISLHYKHPSDKPTVLKVMDINYNDMTADTLFYLETDTILYIHE